MPRTGTAGSSTSSMTCSAGGAAVQREDLARLSLDVPEHESVITPSFTLTEPGIGEVRLLGLVSDGSPVARVTGSDWPATPADRLAQLCRHHGVELGLATDGRWWALVWAPAGGVTTVAVFDAISWPESAERAWCGPSSPCFSAAGSSPSRRNAGSPRCCARA